MGRRLLSVSVLAIVACTLVVASATATATNEACQLLTHGWATKMMGTDAGPAHAGKTRTETGCSYDLLNGRPYNPQQGLSRAFADRGKSVWLDITKSVPKADFSIPSNATKLSGVGEAAYVYYFKAVSLYTLEIWKPRSKGSDVGRTAEFQVVHCPNALPALVSIARHIASKY